ncbi:hypothetical protein Tco_0737650 [Tanacetum coccineum]
MKNWRSNLICHLRVTIISGIGQLFSDNYFEIHYRSRKANDCADALRRNERAKPKTSMEAMYMTISVECNDKIFAVKGGFQDGIPLIGDVRTIIMDETCASRHGVSVSIISDCDGRSTSAVFADVAKALRTRLDISTTLSSSNARQIITRVYDVLHLRHCMEGDERLKAARDLQKSYVDNRRKPLEFKVGDQVLLKVPPWKGVVRFGKKEKLVPRCLADANLHVPLGEVKIDKTLHFIEEPVEIMDREVKKLKRRIPIVKVRWNSRRGPKFTWE